MSRQSSKQVKLDADLIEGFQRVYLLPTFDNPVPPGDVHRDMWARVCSDHPKVALAAPRNHAKSTAITHTYALALVLFRVRDFGLIVADTEGQAIQFLHDIIVELQENEALIRDFGIKKFTKDSATEIEVMFNDGTRFCIMAKGSEQKVRGTKWRNKRPNFILGDDLENDETVQNPDRILKFKNWVLNALLPCGSKNCIYRIVGTILHDAAVLEQLLNDPNWSTARYRAHESFSDFSNILWPEQYDAAYFQDKQAQYLSQGNPEGYSKEYLNDPIPAGHAIFDVANIIENGPEFYGIRKTYYCATDFAVSTKQRADFSVFLVFAIDVHGYIEVVEVRRGRWDPEELVTQWFQLNADYESMDMPIQEYVVEEGIISKSILPYLNDRMLRESVFLNLRYILPTQDKQKRARAIQGRTKAGGVRANKRSSWWPAFEFELRRFPAGKNDDQVDCFSQIGLVIDRLVQPESSEEQEYNEWVAMDTKNKAGRDRVTGY